MRQSRKHNANGSKALAIVLQPDMIVDRSHNELLCHKAAYLMNTPRRFVLCLSAGTVLMAVLAGVSCGEGIEAITRPSEDVTLSFVRPGRIAKILVREGDEVRLGETLVKQDDAAELVQLEQLKAEADSTVRVKAAEAQLAQKKVEHESMKDAFKKQAVPKWDVARARLAVTIAELSLELARFEHVQASRKYQEFKLQVERMRLKSPIAGKVEKLFVKPGESADALADVVRVVRTDPLWIDVPAPLAQAKRLKCEQTAHVSFGKAGETKADGKIIHIAAVADPAQSLLARRAAAAGEALRLSPGRLDLSTIEFGFDRAVRTAEVVPRLQQALGSGEIGRAHV